MVVWNLPNILSLSRIAVVPIVLLFLASASWWGCFFAALLFIAAALTDMVDGYLARKAGQITSFGKFVDPLADKVLISAVLVMLVQLGWVGGWVAIIIISRDLMVTGLRAIAADEGMVIAADKYGKIKTILQIVALVPLMLHYPLFGLPSHQIGTWLLYLATALTVYSGWNYFAVFFYTTKEKKHPHQENKTSSL